MTFRLHGVVLPGDRETEIFVVDGRITFAPVEGATTLIEDAVVLPGLVDVHAHLAMQSPLPDAPARGRAEASARVQLEAGVLAIREPGSPNHASTGIGPTSGLPRVYTAGRFLAPVGRYFPSLAREVADAELPDAAVEEFAVSGAWVKVIGDSPIPGPGLEPTFSADALAEAARRVHDGGGRIAIHCALTEVIQIAIDTGFDSIEHGNLFEDEQLTAAAERGVAWVPTLSINDSVPGLVAGIGAAAMDDLVARLRRQPEMVARAVEAGVTVLAGTDAGLGPHGMIRHEIELLRAGGLSTTAALATGSWIAREWLGLPGIEEGAPADLVAFRDDPREDLSVLAAPDVIVLDGQVIGR